MTRARTVSLERRLGSLPRAVFAPMQRSRNVAAGGASPRQGYCPIVELKDGKEAAPVPGVDAMKLPNLEMRLTTSPVHRGVNRRYWLLGLFAPLLLGTPGYADPITSSITSSWHWRPMDRQPQAFLRRAPGACAKYAISCFILSSVRKELPDTGSSPLVLCYARA